MKSNDEIRRELASLLSRRRLRSGLWAHLIHLGCVMRVARGEWSLSRLAAVYTTTEETLYPSDRPRQQERREFTQDLRAYAVAEMVAIDAMTPSLGIEDFRRIVLGDKLLTLDEVDGWVQRQVEREGPLEDSHTRVPVSRDNELWTHIWHEPTREEYACWLEREAARVRQAPDCELPRIGRAGSLKLAYIDGDNREREVRIRQDGYLAHLEMVSRGRSMMTYGAWSAAEAATFVLTDERPMVVGMSIKGPPISMLPAASSINIRINPRVPPRDLAKAYANARSRCVPARDRAMSEKHVRLAVFVHREHPHEIPWVKMREEWNEANPQWRYETAGDPPARRFALEARASWCRVTGMFWLDRRKKVRRLSNDDGVWRAP
jgi:hypothetical protein